MTVFLRQWRLIMCQVMKRPPPLSLLLPPKWCMNTTQMSMNIHIIFMFLHATDSSSSLLVVSPQNRVRQKRLYTTRLHQFYLLSFLMFYMWPFLVFSGKTQPEVWKKSIAFLMPCHLSVCLCSLQLTAFLGNKSWNAHPFIHEWEVTEPEAFKAVRSLLLEDYTKVNRD